MFISEFLLILTVIIQTLLITIGLLADKPLSSICILILIVIFGLIALAVIINEINTKIKERKFKKLLPELEGIFIESVKQYHKSKYGEDVKVNHLKLTESADKDIFFGEIYLDEDENKIVFMKLKYSSLEILKVSDNIQNDSIIKDATTLIKESLKDFDVNFAIHVNRTGNKEFYDGNLKDYMDNNNLQFTLIVEKKIDNEWKSSEHLDYYSEFSEKISSIIKADLVNVIIDLIFTNDKIYEKIGTVDFIKYYDEVSDIFGLVYENILDGGEIATNNCFYGYPCID